MMSDKKCENILSEFIGNGVLSARPKNKTLLRQLNSQPVIGRAPAFALTMVIILGAKTVEVDCIELGKRKRRLQ